MGFGWIGQPCDASANNIIPYRDQLSDRRPSESYQDAGFFRRATNLSSYAGLLSQNETSSHSPLDKEVRWGECSKPKMEALIGSPKTGNRQASKQLWELHPWRVCHLLSERQV